MRWWVAVPVGVAVTVAVVAATVLIAGGAGAPQRYLEPWNAGHHEQFDDPRVQLAAHGLLAPSGHNEQPSSGLGRDGPSLRIGQLVDK